jgi:hypothetical protein
MLKNSDISD